MDFHIPTSMEFRMPTGFEMGLQQAYDQLISPTFLLPLVIIIVLFKFIRIMSRPEPPRVHYETRSGGNRMSGLVASFGMLEEPYVSPYLWGRNGHFQTAVYGLFHYKSLLRTSDRREGLRLEDGTLTTFDIFEPTAEHAEGDYTFALCPGIANHSQNAYIKRFFHHAQEAGFRCAVLNHVGALKGIPVTTPKIFTYGSTVEYEAMVKRILALYPETRIIVVGFSMGGNIVTKYLGTTGRALSSRILCGISICQGYDANKAAAALHEWRGLRRLLNYVMTEKVKSLLRRNHAAAVRPHVRSGLVDDAALFTATSLYHLDEVYSRRVHGFESVEEYYRWCSCIHSIDKVEVPMIYLNAEDDPIIPASLWQPMVKHAEGKADTLFVLTKHGGHLGYVEGRSLAPLEVSWLDRFAVGLANAAIATYGKGRKCASVPRALLEDDSSDSEDGETRLRSASAAALLSSAD